MKKKCLVLLLCFFALPNYSADIRSILPITNKIIVIEFDEGHIDYFSKNQDRYNGNKLYYSLLDKDKAVDIANYIISSPDDSNYFSKVNPVNIGRKSKGEEFHNLYDPSNPSALRNHWVYIILPYEMERGKHYLIELNDLASNKNIFEFNYDEFNLRSPAIHVNQIGFVPSAPKYAYISEFMGHFKHDPSFERGLDLNELNDLTFHVVNNNSEIRFTGAVKKQQAKESTDFYKTDIDFTNLNMTRADVWECDFKEFSEPGEYKIVVEGMGCSFPFEIQDDVYREPFNLTMRAMFYQRSGILKEIEPGVEYPRDYRPEDGTIIKYFPDLKDSHSFDENGGTGEVKGIWGWYHDAGDFDTYSTHYRVPMTLLALYDMKPENFGDGDVNQKYKINPEDDWVEEGNNNLPDILDEAQWLIKYYRRAKDSLISQGYTDGGVPGYTGVDAGAGDGKPSWEDKRILSLQGGNNVLMSYRYAALTAYLAICLDKSTGGVTHPQSSDWLNESITAYQWAENQNQQDSKINDAKMEAAAALYRYTGELKYQEYLNVQVYNSDSWGDKLWFNIQPWHYTAGIIGLIPDEFPGLDISLKEKCVNDISAAAEEECVNSANSRGFRYGIDKDIIFMLGTFSVPHIFTSALAYEFTSDKKYLDACFTTSDYCLGGNQMNLVRITGLGDKYEQSVFHPNSWYLFDYNSKVYRNPILPGYTAYDMHRNGDWQSGNLGNIGNGWSWVGDEDFSRSTAYPGINDFPDSEARFQNRNSIAGSEFTIHQNQIMAIFAYGYLCDEYSIPFIGNDEPTVVLNLEEGIECPKDTTLILSVSASEDTRKVEYYYEWHYIGESSDSDSGFQFIWDMAEYKMGRGNILITAKAIDKKGKISKPSDEADAIIRVLNITSVGTKNSSMGKFELHNNYPNPFNPETTISYEIADNSNVNLAIFDILGNHVITLVDNYQNKGLHYVKWDGTDDKGEEVASGIYFQKFSASEYMINKKMLLLR